MTTLRKTLKLILGIKQRMLVTITYNNVPPEVFKANQLLLDNRDGKMQQHLISIYNIHIVNGDISLNTFDISVGRTNTNYPIMIIYLSCTFHKL